MAEMTDAVATWRAREDAALVALLREAGVTQAQLDEGGPDGQELRELIFAPVDTWNAFGIIAQDWDATDDDVHARLVAGFAVDADDDDEWTWHLAERDEHDARPDDDNEPGDRCKDCGRPITWDGPSHLDWSHV